MWKKHKIIMLPTDREIQLNSIVEDPTFGLGQIILKYEEECFYNTHKSGGSIITPWKRNLDDKLKSYHLYILSDEEIKESDWFIKWTGGKYIVLQADALQVKLSNELWNPVQYYKIIATTDSSLKLNNYSDVDRLEDIETILPQIPQEFISLYIEEYNKGVKIEDVMVEYDENIESLGDPNPNDTKQTFVLKLSNNVISIKEIKQHLYTEDEVYTFLSKLKIDMYDGQDTELGYNLDYFDEWFEENKKK